MSTLLEDIDRFNRKERYFLFTYAARGDSSFPLSAKFRAALGKELGVDIPAEGKGYIDYHLDWLHAAVVLAGNGGATGPHENWEPGTAKPQPPNKCEWVSTGTQEDIDLLVVFEQDEVTWLMLVEAKGVSAWGNEQLNHKVSKLERLLKHLTADTKAHVQLRLCLLSPMPPVGLFRELGGAWPEWMVHPNKKRPYWIKLPVPGGRKKVTGCTDTGASSGKREYWMVEDVSGEELVESE